MYKYKLVHSEKSPSFPACSSVHSPPPTIKIIVIRFLCLFSVSLCMPKKHRYRFLLSLFLHKRWYIMHIALNMIFYLQYILEDFPHQCTVSCSFIFSHILSIIWMCHNLLKPSLFGGNLGGLILWLLQIMLQPTNIINML